MQNRILFHNGKSLEVPVIQGGMGVGISLSSLAGAVMKEDGMGVISAAHPGYRKPDFWKNSMICNIQAMHEEIAKAKEWAQGKGLCGVNIMVASKDYEFYVKAAVDAKADAIISGAGLPMHLPAIVKDADILLAPIVSSGRAAKLILKTWDRHHHRLPDFIVIEGSLAGGHLGFKKEDLITNKAEPLEKILADVKALLPEFEERYQRQVPIFVAGGIYDAQDIRHFCDLGAAGVQMGTRFIATQECDASPAFKEVIVQAQKEDIELVKSPAGLPGRAVMTDFMRQVKEKRIAPSHCIGCMLPCKPATTPYCISEALIHAVHGEVEQGLVFAGANAWRITEIVTVKQLMDELKAAFI